MENISGVIKMEIYLNKQITFKVKYLENIFAIIRMVPLNKPRTLKVASSMDKQLSIHKIEVVTKLNIISQEGLHQKYNFNRIVLMTISTNIL